MYLARILIVGETAVGKTSLLIRFNEDKYFVSQKSTIGVDYKAKEVDIDGEIVKLQVSIHYEQLTYFLMFVNERCRYGTRQVKSAFDL